jgi:hypothetical protein
MGAIGGSRQQAADITTFQIVADYYQISGDHQQYDSCATHNNKMKTLFGLHQVWQQQQQPVCRTLTVQ